MNNNPQSRFIPYEADYALLKKWRLITNILLGIVSLLSIASPFVTTAFTKNIIFKEIVDYSSYITIIAYYVADLVTEVFLYPATARLRRIGFIDNSLGTRYLAQESINYFSNDILKPSLYKMSVNCFENCFFTYNIAKKMTPTVVTKNVLFSTIFLTTAYIGLRGNNYALPILRILLSALFITELAHHLTFVSRLRILLEKFMTHFYNTMKSKPEREYAHYPILMLLEYETTLAFNKAPLSDRIYFALNPKLSKEWEDLKLRYEIA